MIIQVYLPTNFHSNEKIEEIYERTEEILRQTKNSEIAFYHR